MQELNISFKYIVQTFLSFFLKIYVQDDCIDKHDKYKVLELYLFIHMPKFAPFWVAICLNSAGFQKISGEMSVLPKVFSLWSILKMAYLACTYWIRLSYKMELL